MKKVLWIIAALLLLSGCASPMPEPEPEDTDDYGVYEMTFSVEQLSGNTAQTWDIVYTYNGVTVESGYRFTFPLGLFSFHSVQADAVEKGRPDSTVSAMILVAICDGGSGNVEITLPGASGTPSVIRITCYVERVGRIPASAENEAGS